ncbi:YcaO-like family protein [Bradyrhizobium sp. OAE829]|uniref:YcaO-like family protein n=1 Tax=Bradyrhizobium sp. OAE829 TaxID=2663807 RepID=UPI00178A9290
MIEAHARPGFMEIDLTSEQGSALQRAVSDRYGSKIAQSARLARRIFLVRSPWAPGLRFVGAETWPQAPHGALSDPISFSLSGSGERLEEAFVSCVGEGIDRLAQIECPGDVTTVADFPAVKRQVPSSVAAAIEQDMADQTLAKSTPLAWARGKLLDTEHAFDSCRDVLIPADWCFRRTDASLKPRTALSVGVAAGPTFDWAASRALLELIERDAASLWWQGGRRGKAIALDDPAMGEIVRLMRALRQQTDDRTSWLLDITTDVGIPVIAALSCDKDGRQLAYGLSARLSIEEAARGAILELCQTELAILFARIKRDEAGEQMLSPSDRAHVERIAAIHAECDLLHSIHLRVYNDTPATGSELSLVGGAMAKSGIETVLVDMTRPQFDIPVVRALAPALQPMPSRIMTDRLVRACRDHGGGDRYTGGLTLME